MFENESYETYRIDKQWNKYHETIRDKKYEKEDYLGFVEISKNTYRVYNKKTERFHNLNFGIDEVV